MRSDGRKNNELRCVRFQRGYLKYALGSCLAEMGDTKVICTASLEEKTPLFLKGTGKGWVTAEYGMLPASCSDRIPREASRGRPSGRTQEIQRLIGRSLRAVTSLEKLGERTIWIDTDVIQGDGGTRTAAISGSFLAMADAVLKLQKRGIFIDTPIKDFVGAVSVGMVRGEPMLDLCYEEDSGADVDFNVVMTGAGQFIEVQGTAEKAPFSRENLNALINLAGEGIARIVEIQKQCLGS